MKNKVNAINAEQAKCKIHCLGKSDPLDWMSWRLIDVLSGLGTF
uniref:Uncharacterized protein n=1 Tax=Anguilla anguilla TaxID=7936 RepID=A0A0E9UC69_ANGAN